MCKGLKNFNLIVYYANNNLIYTISSNKYNVIYKKKCAKKSKLQCKLLP